MLRHPEVYYRSCEDCQKFLYDEKTGAKCLHRGEPLARTAGNLAPCRRVEGSCPKGTPENPKVLSERNERAYQHFKRCKLTGRWPDDGLVLDRAVLLQEIEEFADRQVADERLETFVTLQMLSGRK